MHVVCLSISAAAMLMHVKRAVKCLSWQNVSLSQCEHLYLLNGFAGQMGDIMNRRIY